MSKYILRWQFGFETRMYYTYGHINTLKEKAEVLKSNERISYITIDEIKEVVKDTREKEFLAICCLNEEVD